MGLCSIRFVPSLSVTFISSEMLARLVVPAFPTSRPIANIFISRFPPLALARRPADRAHRGARRRAQPEHLGHRCWRVTVARQRAVTGAAEGSIESQPRMRASSTRAS